MSSLYRKLAFTNLKNSKQFYLPYLLMGILSVMMFYSMVAMGGNSGLSKVRGATNLKSILGLGTAVIGIFVCILLFYSNSFIMKRRKKELGVYNILGMEKKHIAKVLFWENLSTYVLAVAGGLGFGILFNKLLLMLLYRMTGLSESISFSVSGRGCIQTAELFALIYLLTLLYNFMQVKLANPVELLRGGNTGEREPKTKIFLALFGAVCLLTAYYIAFTTENIMQVLTLFFVAVLLVIAGTYAIFTAGSIALLKLLRNNKKYYYQTKHFTAVSGLIYRMKQNAAGLASICILSTMVLVMISTTVSMYAGIEDEIDIRYEGDAEISFYYGIVPDATYKEALLHEIKDCVKTSGRSIENLKATVHMGDVIVRNKNVLETYDVAEWDVSINSEIGVLSVMTKSEYEAAENTTLSDIGQGQAAVIASPEYEEDTVILRNREFQVSESRRLSQEESIFDVAAAGGELYLVVQDDAALQEILEDKIALAEKNQDSLQPEVEYQIVLDIDGTKEEKIDCVNRIRERIQTFEGSGKKELAEVSSYSVMSKQEGYDDYISLNGGLLFLGLFLGLMFSMVTVLIIYYKQISEGYEDKERFAIMEKVGMSRREVKAAISSQVRIVFFLPLIAAAVHLAAAFPMLNRLLAMLNLYNSRLFAACLLATLLVFGLIYFIVFRLTSKTYYKIVA